MTPVQGPYVKPPAPDVRRRCRSLVLAASKRHKIPPAFIVAHVNEPVANEARREVMVQMIRDLGMKRCEVALMFNRSLRRVRASEIGGPRTRHGYTGPDYSKMDLFGQPLPPTAKKCGIPAVTYRDRYREVVGLLRIKAGRSPVARQILEVVEVSRSTSDV